MSLVLKKNGGNGGVNMTREEAIKILEGYKLESEEDYWLKRAEALGKGIEALKNQKTGHWIIDINDKDYCFCQFCRHKFDIDRLKMVWGTYEFPPYCPNCGAELKGE